MQTYLDYIGQKPKKISDVMQDIKNSKSNLSSAKSPRRLKKKLVDTKFKKNFG